MEQLRLLAMHAHPDDESSKGAGTMARYADEGVRVTLMCATGGEAGDVLNPLMAGPDVVERMAEIRSRELDNAARVLGVEHVYRLGYRDSGMPGSSHNEHPAAFANAASDEAIGRIVEVIRRERPHVVLGYDEHKGYEHPDHICVHRWGDAAWRAASDPQMYPDKGDPWAPAKLYHFATWSRRRLHALHEAAIAAGIESPYAGWLDNWDQIGLVEPEITAQVHVGPYVQRRSEALLAHETQIEPGGFWFAIPDEMHREVYPWEDYALVEAQVPVSPPETDLFAGIRET